MNCISTSVFDIFKIGPGPSSSHTIGPMRAGNDFITICNKLSPAIRATATHVCVTFFGSLALTGKGHGSDRAAVAGLLGQIPETCDITLLKTLLSEKSAVYPLPALGQGITLCVADVVFNKSPHQYPYSNTMSFQLRSADNAVLHEEIYYSIGGGFLLREMPRANDGDIEVPYRYRNWETFCRLTTKYAMSPVEIVTQNEMAITGMTQDAVRARATQIINAMCDCVARGLQSSEVLPGILRLGRRAKDVYTKAQSLEAPEERFLLLIDAFALAAAEENAAGHLVVTAPTSGASGLMPGIIYFLREIRHVPMNALIDGLLVAGVIGLVAKSNASISGAEAGCQAEIGVAAAMGAAFLAQVNGHSVAVAGCAAEIALEHHLGLSCDPVDGYVQIPCIERNAVGAVTAYNACTIASFSNPDKQKVSFDEVLEAMRQTGQCMAASLKETSLGGLAVCALCG